ncbi:MAG: hypothetical protein JXJ20_04770 [Anaerolineae bacterium]|jgi:hypothetical protein|nr:hypothetical protein [Anaerolineae bacterium]
MTRRYVGSLLIGVLVGLAFGIFLGWEQFPVEYTNSSMEALAPRYQEQYTVMVAEGYQVDRDKNAALARLQVLGKSNVFDYVQALTEQYISQSNVPAISTMVALAEAMGRLTPVMEIYRLTPVPTPLPQFANP